MSEPSQQVTVHGTQARTNYPTAINWTIDDHGALRITEPNGRQIAAYANGHWARVELTTTR